MSQKVHMEQSFDKTPKTNPFKVPEHYFDSFQEHMAEKIVREQRKHAHKTSPVWNWNMKQLIPVFAPAAVMVLVLIGIFWFNTPSKPNLANPGEMAEIYRYSALSEMNDTELMNQLVKIHEQKTAVIDTISRQKDNLAKETMDYLSSEDIGMDELINAL